MFILKQYKSQIISQIALYNEGAETGPKPVEGPKKPVEGPKTGKDIEATGKDAHKIAEEIDGVVDEGLDRVTSIRARLDGDTSRLTPDEMRQRVILSDEERMMLTNDSDIMKNNAIIDHILEGRRTELGKLVQVEVSGEKIEISQEALISQVVKESGISAELLTEMKVMGQLGIHEMNGEELKERLKSMSEEMQRIKIELEQDGQEFPEDPAEFLALYEVHIKNDHIGDTPKLDKSGAENAGLDVIEDENDGIGINPKMPGVQVVGNTVIAPDGSYSRGGNIYTPLRIEGSQTGVEVSVAEEEMTKINPPNTSPELEAYTHEINQKIIRERVPAEWHGAAIKMAQKVGTMQEGKVIALATMTGEKGPEAIVCYPDGRINTFPIIVGKNGYAESVSKDDSKTPINVLFNFNSGKDAGRGKDASKTGSTTVIGGAIYSPEAGALGGRWWHGVADHRIPGGATAGCIGARQENMILMARAVNEHGGGYGMNVLTKKG